MKAQLAGCSQRSRSARCSRACRRGGSDAFAGRASLSCLPCLPGLSRSLSPASRARCGSQCCCSPSPVRRIVSAVYRQTILQTYAPDEMRGRMQGVFIVVVAGGPRLGDLRAGATREFRHRRLVDRRCPPMRCPCRLRPARAVAAQVRGTAGDLRMAYPGPLISCVRSSRSTRRCTAAHERNGRHEDARGCRRPRRPAAP